MRISQLPYVVLSVTERLPKNLKHQRAGLVKVGFLRDVQVTGHQSQHQTPFSYTSGKGGNLYDAYDPLNYLMVKPGYPYKGAPFFPDVSQGSSTVTPIRREHEGCNPAEPQSSERWRATVQFADVSAQSRNPTPLGPLFMDAQLWHKNHITTCCEFGRAPARDVGPQIPYQGRRPHRALRPLDTLENPGTPETTPEGTQTTEGGHSAETGAGASATAVEDSLNIPSPRLAEDRELAPQNTSQVEIRTCCDGFTPHLFIQQTST